MRYAIISDIHSNLEALRTVLKDIRKRPIDKIFCLGDIVGYGPNPLDVLDFMRNFEFCLVGNHDDAVINSIPPAFNPIAAEAARWNANLYFDVTGSTLFKFIKLNRLEDMSKILWWSAEEGDENPHTLKDGPSAWEHIVFGTDERPTGLPGNIERFSMMLEANNVPADMRERMWGLTMAENLGIDPETHRFKNG